MSNVDMKALLVEVNKETNRRRRMDEKASGLATIHPPHQKGPYRRLEGSTDYNQRPQEVGRRQSAKSKTSNVYLVVVQVKHWKYVIKRSTMP